MALATKQNFFSGRLGLHSREIKSRDGRNIKPAHTIDDSNAALEMGWKYEL
jgi:hypothetical protein